MSRNIVLGVTGGIAVYKAVTLTSLLVKHGYNVWVVMTESATKFVTPLTFQTISKHSVYVDIFDERDPDVVSHIDIADKADLVVVAPATANIIAKVAGGIANDMLSTLLLATTAPVVFAPAMNVHMYSHPAFQENLRKLLDWGYQMIDSEDGLLACGYTGKGRLAEPEAIFAWIEQFFHGERPLVKSPNPDPLLEFRKKGQVTNLDLLGKKVLITAGPTQEAIDPVRYITNRSSGKMGYALADACVKRGAQVILVTGKTNLTPPNGVEVHQITTAEQMASLVAEYLESVDWIIGTAAVADYRPKVVYDQKLKKKNDTLVLELVKTTDILKMVGERRSSTQTVIGFAAETENIIEHAKSKLVNKNLDYIVLNDVSKADIGFDSDQNEITILTRAGLRYDLPRMNKSDLALQIVETIVKDIGTKQ